MLVAAVTKPSFPGQPTYGVPCYLLPPYLVDFRVKHRVDVSPLGDDLPSRGAPASEKNPGEKRRKRNLRGHHVNSLRRRCERSGRFSYEARAVLTTARRPGAKALWRFSSHSHAQRVKRRTTLFEIRSVSPRPAPARQGPPPRGRVRFLKLKPLKKCRRKWTGSKTVSACANASQPAPAAPTIAGG